MQLDLDFVRSQFPAFSEPSLYAHAHFENAGGSYVCQQVIRRLHDFYSRTKVQPYHPSPISMLAGAKMDESYRRLAEYLNVDESEVHLGPSTSQNTVTLANAYRKILQPGDEVIVTNQDHEANTGVWRKLADEGMVVREWQIDPESGRLDIADLDKLINERTKLLTFPHASNIVAWINPVAEICAKARAAGVTTVVDGVSFAGHGMPDVDALGADIYLFSLYKVYGPHQGVMTVRTPVAEQLGNQSHFFNKGEPHKQLCPAGPDHAQVAAAAGVAEYFDALAAHHIGQTAAPMAERAATVRSLLHNAEISLMPPLLDYLQERSDVRLLGSNNPEERAPTISFIPKNHAPEAVCTALGDKGIMAGHGHFYSYRTVQGLKEDQDQGVVRLSFVHYTSPEEIQKAISVLDQIL